MGKGIELSPEDQAIITKMGPLQEKTMKVISGVTADFLNLLQLEQSEENLDLVGQFVSICTNKVLLELHKHTNTN